MSEFTPGPWKAERAKRPDNTGGYDYAIADQDHQIIAECFEHTGYAGGTERQYIIQPAEANAALIAAAPDLLAALERIVTNYDTGNYKDIDMPQARAAIARATHPTTQQKR